MMLRMLMAEYSPLVELPNMLYPFFYKLAEVSAKVFYQCRRMLSSEEVRHYHIISSCLIQLESIINLVGSHHDYSFLVQRPYLFKQQ